MATGRSTIPSQLSQGRCGGDEGRLTHSPSIPRTLRERVLCSSPRHADHDTEDGGQSGHLEGRAAVRQGEERYAGEEADADEEPGVMTVTWRADVTLQFSVVNFAKFRGPVRKIPRLTAAKLSKFHGLPRLSVCA